MTAAVTAAGVDHPHDLITDALAGMTDAERDQFTAYLLPALTTTLPADRVAAAITAAQRCIRVRDESRRR